MKHTALCLAVVLSLLAGSCRRQPNHVFTNLLLLPMTPVKDQGKTQLCWAYAMLATIETEHLVRGDSVNLSAQYIGRHLANYQSSIVHSPLPRQQNQRAMCQTLLNMLPRCGLCGYDVMPDDASPTLPMPRNVFMLGARYTPREFAHSVCAPGEYVSLTCIPDSPYYQSVDVPIPDNWEHNRLLNIPRDTLVRRINRALRNRHPVCWESRGHAMAIVGMARDEQQRSYYILKNSWGTDQPHDGLVYMPAGRLWRDMVAVYLTRDAYEGR